MGRIPKYIQPRVSVGQIWKDYNCSRQDRSVKILEISRDDVKILNVKTGRVTTANILRFDGNAKGYKNYEFPNPKWEKK